MSRSPRHQAPGLIQHVTQRTTSGLTLFGDDAERRLFLRLVGSTCRELHWTCLSYCLMSNHVHLLVRPTHGNLSDGMQRVATRYARHYNVRRGRHGHLFQGRFWSAAVNDLTYLREVTRYIALNPVRAGVVGDPGRYPWSAHRALLGLTTSTLVAPNRTLEAFGRGQAALENYAEFVGDISAGARFAMEYESPPRPDARLDELARTLDRDHLIRIAHLEHGYSLAAIARELGCARSTVTRRLRYLTNAQRAVTDTLLR